MADQVAIFNAGGIHGGHSGKADPNDQTQANAVELKGDDNTLELHKGYSFTGDVVAGGSNNTLALGGSVDDSFDVSDIGGSQQYQGFAAFEKTGDSTWTLTNTTSETTPWTITDGTLSVSADDQLGDTDGDLTLDGGTLQVTGTNFTATNRDIIWGNAGGTFDIADADNNFIVDDDLDGNGHLNKAGAGTLTLTGANTYI